MLGVHYINAYILYQPRPRTIQCIHKHRIKTKSSLQTDFGSHFISNITFWMALQKTAFNGPKTRMLGISMFWVWIPVNWHCYNPSLVLMGTMVMKMTVRWWWWFLSTLLIILLFLFLALAHTPKSPWDILSSSC